MIPTIRFTIAFTTFFTSSASSSRLSTKRRKIVGSNGRVVSFYKIDILWLNLLDE